jgi:hypothetical protein
MAPRTLIIAAAFGVMALLGSAAPGGIATAQAACDPGTRVDGSTADDARRKMMSAGFRQVRDLRKGCDSAWHGIASKDGAQTRVVLTPDGKVQIEND